MQRKPSTWMSFTTLWLLCVVFFVGTQTASAIEPTVPLWQQGVSTFDGTDYTLPDLSSVSNSLHGLPASNAGSGAKSGAKSDAVAYTMPVDPTQQVESVSGLSDSIPSLNPPTLPPPIPSYSPVGPEDSAKRKSASEKTVPLTDASNQTIGSGAADQSNDISDDMSAQLDSAAFDGPAPLDQEVIRWYQYPRRWSKGWDSHAEFGLDGSDGNADTLAIQMGIETKRKTDLYTFALDLDYRQASSRGVTTEDNGRLNLDYDRMLRDSNWAIFSKLGLEWDTFKAFDLRLNLNGGLGYHWIRNDTTTLVTRFGAGASREFGSPVDDWTPEGVFGIEAERQLTERQKIKGKLDYFPAWDDFGDYRLVADVSWEILLDGSENFSLKVAATDRYDSTPQGALANDLYYSLLLLYKF